MAELGIDISRQESKTLDRYRGEPFDAVITVCDRANDACPVFAGARMRLHWSLPDPAAATGTEDEQLARYRSVRDALRRRIEDELVTRAAD
jgi:arsenate reductase